MKRNQTWSYSYNRAGQLTSSTSSNLAYNWVSAPPTTTNYTVDGQNKLLTAGTGSLTHDGRGNISSDGITNYGYDIANRLVSAASTTLGWDPADRLGQVTGSATTRYLYDGDQIIAEYDASGALLRRYVPGASLDEPVGWLEGPYANEPLFLLGDRMGSIAAVTSSAGTTINTYDDYGAPAGSNQGLFGLDGQPWLKDIGLYHARARAYSPAFGRFMQTDPIGYGDGLNLYNYVHSDPVNGWDPSGTVLVFAGANCRYLGGGVGDDVSFSSTPVCTPQFVDIPDILGVTCP